MTHIHQALSPTAATSSEHMSSETNSTTQSLVRRNSGTSAPVMANIHVIASLALLQLASMKDADMVRPGLIESIRSALLVNPLLVAQMSGSLDFIFYRSASQMGVLRAPAPCVVLVVDLPHRLIREFASVIINASMSQGLSSASSSATSMASISGEVEALKCDNSQRKLLKELLSELATYSQALSRLLKEQQPQRKKKQSSGSMSQQQSGASSASAMASSSSSSSSSAASSVAFLHGLYIFSRSSGVLEYLTLNPHLLLK